MIISQDFSLKNFNTFHVEAKAKYFAEITSTDELLSLSSQNTFKNNEKLILGGGSNLLFTSDYNGLVIKNSILGIEEIDGDSETVKIKCGSGVVWDDLVSYCVGKNYGGIENLALIPGTVGAAPIQNIGAYGAELKDVFHSLKGIYLSGNEVAEFSKDECRFGYRSSIFKNELKGKFIITAVTIILNKKPKLNIAYSSLKEELLNIPHDELTIEKVSSAVKKIRREKLADPEKLGNAGSFFKNPEIDQSVFEELNEKFEDLISFSLESNRYKIPAGWLIEKCGLKGFKKGSAGTYKNQALVIVNYGSATGKEIYELSNYIKEKVYDKFGIELEREVNVI